MRADERQYIRYEGIGFYSLEGSMTSKTDRDVMVSGGFDLRIPAIDATLCRLVLARHASGEYTTRQAWIWFQKENQFDDIMERLYDETPFDPKKPLRTRDEAFCRAWLKERHDLNDVIPELDEYIREMASAWAATYAPDWLDYRTAVGSGMGSGEVGRFTLPKGRNLADVTDHMQAAIERAIEA
ncbi:hypothetical protein CTI14_39545, partial [Methylobacterium radiotolerans]